MNKRGRFSPKAKTVAPPPWYPPTPPVARPDRVTPGEIAGGIAAGFGYGGGVADASSAGHKQKRIERQKLSLKSGNRGVRMADNKTWERTRNNGAVRGITRLGTSPLVKRAGYAGMIIGYGSSWTKYSHDNGGDLELAHAQAGFDLAAGAAGAWGGAKLGAAIGSFFGPVGTIVGAAIGAGVGGFAAGYVAGRINDNVSEARVTRKLAWG